MKLSLFQGKLRGRRSQRMGPGAVFIVAALFLISGGATAQQDDWQGVARIVAVGDVHGDFDNYRKVLRQADLIDRRGRWIGGKTHLVQLGDLPDRGPDTDQIIRHLMALEEQAEKAGGRVHVLIGNHDAMNMTGDLRYVHPGEFKALKSRQARRLREAYFERVLAYLEAEEDPRATDEAFREEWFETHPLGWVEHRQHWDPAGDFGNWTARHNTVLRINRTLFVHAGISPAYRDWPRQQTNDQVRRELETPLTLGEDALVNAEDGPLWYRGLSMGEESEEIADHVAATLEAFDVDRIVVGHTPGFATVVPRYDARVLVADTGIADHYGGHLASLLIEGDAVYTLQRGEKIPVPESAAGLLDYYRAVDEVEPGVNNLRYMIQKFSAPASTESDQPAGREAEPPVE